MVKTQEYHKTTQVFTYRKHHSAVRQSTWQDCERRNDDMQEESRGIWVWRNITNTQLRKSKTNTSQAILQFPLHTSHGTMATYFTTNISNTFCKIESTMSERSRPQKSLHSWNDTCWFFVPLIHAHSWLGWSSHEHSFEQNQLSNEKMWRQKKYPFKPINFPVTAG